MSRDEPNRIQIRLAGEDDWPALERLAQLDGARLPSGDVLLAVVDGTAAAALPLDGGRAIADPFRPTAALVALLELRREQLAEGTPQRSLRLRLVPRARPA
jgi:hypothetical protein